MSKSTQKFIGSLVRIVFWLIKKTFFLLYWVLKKILKFFIGLIGYAKKEKMMNIEQVVKKMKKEGYSDKEIKKELLGPLSENVLGSFGISKSRVEKLVKELENKKEKPTVFDNTIEYKWILGKCDGDWYQFLKNEGQKVKNKTYCPDCLGRKNETGNREFFDSIGRPREGFSVCRTGCNCRIVRV